MHPPFQAQAPGLSLVRGRLVLADHEQAGVAGQPGQGLQGPVQALGAKAGAHEQQHRRHLTEAQLGAQDGAAVQVVGGLGAVPPDARRQRHEPPVRGAVMVLVKRLLRRRDREHSGGGVRAEHGGLHGQLAAVARQQGFQALVAGRQTAVGGVVPVQPRHLVETHHPVEAAQLRGHAAREIRVAGVVAAGGGRQCAHLQPVDGGRVAVPGAGEHRHLVAAFQRLGGDRHHVPLQATVGKVFEQQERQLHRPPPVAGTRSAAPSAVTSINACQTRCGLRLLKQGGFTPWPRLP